MRFIGIGQLRDRAAEMFKAVREDEESFVLTHHGKPFAMILPLDEIELEDLLLGSHPVLQERWESARAEIAQGDYATLPELQETH